MHPQQSQPTNTEWIGKAEAARRLKISERTALSLQKKIKSERRLDPETNQLTVMFDAVAVDRYGYLRQHPNETKNPNAAQMDTQIARLPATDGIALLLQAVQAMRTTPATQPPWLTIEEAVAWSGLTKRWLLECAKGRLLPVDPWAEPHHIRDMGKGTRGGRWRF